MLCSEKIPGGIQSNLYAPLSQRDIEKVVNEALRVLEEAGMYVFSANARSAFRAAGVSVNEENSHVKLPRALVEDAIDSNPSSVTLFSRDGHFDACLERNRVYFGTGGTAIYVIDPEDHKHRASMLRDVALNARMVDSLDNIHVFTINVFPNEITEKNAIDVNRFFHALDHTSKHVMGGLYSLEGCHKVVEMAEEIAGSAESLREKPFISFITLIISPLKIDSHYGDMTFYLAEKGLPVVVPTEPICGTTSPVTLAANVLIHVAETLAGIALVQCVRKGAPGICGSVGSITNLRTMDHVGGAIERAMINAAVAQVVQYLELPLYSTAGTTDASEMEVQASYESAMSSLLVAMSGANYIHDIAGLMNADLTVSYEKLVIDNEILGMCQRVLRGIEVNDETLAADLIIEKGPGADFMAEEHTVSHMRGEFFMPELAVRDKRPPGQLPTSSAISRAKKCVIQILSAKPQTRLNENVRKRLLEKFPEIVTDIPVGI